MNTNVLLISFMTHRDPRGMLKRDTLFAVKDGENIKQITRRYFKYYLHQFNILSYTVCPSSNFLLLLLTKVFNK